jgi:polyribonucleotide nucleotidyltransferase
VYPGKVVNITKFGAFVNVLPGRDGLLHISKLSSLAGGKRINNVEDVLSLGQPVEVRVDDIDPQGKVSLSLANAPEAAPSSSGNGDSGHSAPARSAGNGGGSSSGVSFEDAFEAELVADLGDLGPGGPTASEEAPRGDRGDRGGDRRPRGRSRRR